MTEFDLRTLIDEVLASSDAADANVIAVDVDQRIKDEDLRTALRQTLPAFIRQLNTQQRMATRFEFVPADAKQKQLHIPSAKQAAIRDGWKRSLQDRYKGVGGDSVLLRNMTRDDLLAAAQLREAQGDRNYAKARQLRSLAATLDQHDAPTVGDLPDDVLRLAIGQVAA